ncbi:MAG: septum formation initiator family protein [Phenylobacterium sp.]|uniref:FtsB family cell division protein n=1 Tax=Phenylobacterium sp. TaxID=1871053 RepID=UPI00271B2F94|nr:septum formation initiator family protein [Phenylobacterium sp.]MDO8901011.1 septum formation initiator family protein [Phenylobacterium sp.]
MLTAVRSYISTAALALLIIYFAYHAFTGDQGLLTSAQRDYTLAVKSAELKRLTAQRQDLETRAMLLRDTSLSADLLEERARSLLGYSHPRDYVIRIQHDDSVGG